MLERDKDIQEGEQPDGSLVTKSDFGIYRIYDKDGKYIKTVVNPGEIDNLVADGTAKVAATSCLTRQSIEFIHGKRKVNMRNLNRSYRKRCILKALVASKGVVTPALRASGVSYSSYRYYMKTDKEFEDKIKFIQEAAIDFAESTLFDMIEKGDVASTIFFLKTRGKKRGYSEREISEFVKGNEDIEHLSDDEIEKRIKELESSEGNG